MDLEFADKIANECITHYEKLPKKGKPVPNKEWTLLSAIVMSQDNNLTVVALATGTKCLGQSKMSPRGDLVNDSHAEVLARRCFLRYLYDQISMYKINGSSDIIIRSEENRFEINPEIKFHFFSSHVPCGDASIIPKQGNQHNKRIHEEDEEVEFTTEKRIRLETQLFKTQVHQNLQQGTNELDNTGKMDIHRTGAKCIGGGDYMLPGDQYHTVGKVRTKPGRGDPTLSVSCSDKLARWIACGLQGALLSLLLTRPVLLDSVVIGGGGPFSLDVLQRALINRTGTSNYPKLLQSSVVFPHSKYSVISATKPCPSAILWVRTDYKQIEVCVDGQRQGSTKKSNSSGRLMVCKLELLGTFLSVANDSFEGMTYKEIKSSANQYNKDWAVARSKLGVWTTKPDKFEDFCVNN